MELHINLKNGKSIAVQGFLNAKISGKTYTYTAEQKTEFFPIADAYTYHFIGEKQEVIISGSEISFLNFYS